MQRGTLIGFGVAAVVLGGGAWLLLAARAQAAGRARSQAYNLEQDARLAWKLLPSNIWVATERVGGYTLNFEVRYVEEKGGWRLDVEGEPPSVAFKRRVFSSDEDAKAAAYEWFLHQRRSGAL